jgi:hypothetical protein
MQVSRGGQAETDEGQQCRDWVNNQQRRQRMTCASGEIEVVVAIIIEQAICNSQDRSAVVNSFRCLAPIACFSNS